MVVGRRLSSGGELVVVGEIQAIAIHTNITSGREQQQKRDRKWAWGERCRKAFDEVTFEQRPK